MENNLQSTPTPVTEQVYGFNGNNDYNFFTTALDWLGIGSNARANAFNEAQANINRQREDTAYQRTVEDMKRAGLNPALMYGGGGQVQSNASASSSNQNNQGLGQILTSLITLASSAIKASSKSEVTKTINNYNVK